MTKPWSWVSCLDKLAAKFKSGFALQPVDVSLGEVFYLLPVTRRISISIPSLQSPEKLGFAIDLTMVKFSHGCWHPAQDTIIDWAVEVVKSEARKDTLHVVTVCPHIYPNREILTMY